MGPAHQGGIAEEWTAWLVMSMHDSTKPESADSYRQLPFLLLQVPRLLAVVLSTRQNKNNNIKVMQKTQRTNGSCHLIQIEADLLEHEFVLFPFPRGCKLVNTDRSLGVPSGCGCIGGQLYRVQCHFPAARKPRGFRLEVTFLRHL